ncbi:MAG TPA: lamin tail domain-containing protein, partial [Candidatus Limnocylindria bacterium]|nr:lamin tail domain-containing protein [Candidatus Limnocylindria bacterium]
TNTSTSATITVGLGGTFNWGTNAPQAWGWTAFKWKLDNGPWSAVIPITNPPPFNTLPAITVSNLGNGPHTFFVSGRNDAGYFQDDLFVYPTNSSAPGFPTASRTWTVDATLSRLVINEVLAKNTTLIADGRISDLIELHNSGATTVNLGDMSLTDDPTVARKFIFPPGTTIAPGAYLILYAGNGEAPGHIYTGFALNDSGDGVYLYDRLSNGGGLLDSVAFGLQLPDLSIGRLADGTWGLAQPTFGAANIAKLVGDPNRLRINEWLAASGEIFQQDFIELFNSDPVPVALGGLALSHAPMGLPRESVIPPLSFIAAGGWQAFIADEDVSFGADHVNFKLSAEGGWISLAQTNGTLIDMIVYVSQFPDITQGRSPDGGAAFVSFNQPTPGGGNPGQTVIVTPITTTIVPINQVWHMEASNVDLGVAWRTTNYNDSSWFSGPALFYNYDGGGNQSPPIPALSTIPFTSPKQLTVYFRTTFDYNGPLNGANFVLSHVIDDGCVLYLNNQEVFRYNLPASAVINFSTVASTAISGAPSLLSGIPITLTNLVQGTNYLAIEVHQQGTASSDMAMAIQIDSQLLITNYLDTPIVLSEVFTKNESYTNASGKIVDWVELYNPSTDVVDISDLSLTDDSTIPRRWVFPQGAAVAPGGYYVVEFDDSEPYSPFNAGFELSADSGAVYLFHRPAGGGSLLDVVVYGVQVADLTLSRATPGQNTSWTLGEPTRGAANIAVSLGSAATLKVNEWMPNPVSGEDDWFEIYNPDPKPVALGSIHLTDDLSDPIKHTVRPLSFIGAGPEAFVKFIADSDTAKGADHVGFRLGSTESIGIYTTNAVPTKIDSVSYANAQDGLAYGRLPDGASNLVSFPDSASPEEPNWLPLAGSVVINEILTRTGGPLEQAIELRNVSDVDVAIGGWFLSNAKKDFKRFEIPAGVFIPAGGFKVFYETQFNPNSDLPPSFAFNAFKDDELYLSVADANGNLTGYRTTVKFGASAANVSFGRYEKSTGDDFVALSNRTFGVDNPATVAQFRAGAGASNAYPIVGPLVIDEVHYHPPDFPGGIDNEIDEFIEILNASAAPAPLYDAAHPTNTWRLRDAVDFDFPTNVTVP